MTKYRAILFFILLASNSRTWAQASIAGHYDRLNHIYRPIDTSISTEPFINGAAKFMVKRQTPQSADSTFSDESCGVLDTAGKIIIPAKYDYLSLTSNGYVIATLNNRTELRSLDDRVIIPNKYNWIYEAQNNRYIVNIHNKGYGVVTRKDEVVIPIQYETIVVFGSGYVVVGDDHRALMDSSGKMIIKTQESTLPDPPLWNMAHAGFMVYNQKKDSFIYYKEIEEYHLAGRILAYKRGNKWGLLDTLGSERTAPLYAQMGLYYFNNDSVAYAQNLIGAKKGNKWGVINNYGVTQLKFEYDSLYQWHEITVVRKGSKYGFLKKDHRSTTSLKYDAIFGLDMNESNPLGIIPVKIAGKWGFVDKQAKEVSPPKYDSFSFTAPDTVEVTINAKVGLLDSLGNEIYPCVYKSISYINGKFIVEKF